VADLPARRHWAEAAEAIMTTDTLPKAVSRRVDDRRASVTVTGISKGAGMIRPNMATMLGLRGDRRGRGAGAAARWVREAADASFNRITVDGDTSTNDSLILAASGQPVRCASPADTDPGPPSSSADHEVARELAQAIVRDGEGATKFITVRSRARATRPRPRGRLRDCPFAAGQDRLLRVRSQPRAHPVRDRLRRHRRPRCERSSTCSWTTSMSRRPVDATRLSRRARASG
jgi:hypothetical protein